MYLRKIIAFVLFLLISSIQAKSQIDVDRTMSIGKNAIYFKDYAIAIGHFNQVIDHRDWMAEPYLYRAIAKISLDDYLGAYLDADKATKRNPFLDKAYLIKGISKINMKDTIAGIKEYETGLKYYPSDFPLRYNLAIALYSKNKYVEAKKQLDSIKYFNRSNIDSERLTAECILALGDTVGAEKINDFLLSRNPNYIPSIFIKYNISNNRGNYKDCIKLLDDIEKLDNSIPELFLNRGFIHYSLNNYKNAMADYSKAIDLSPNNLTALNNRALLRNMVGEYNGSIDDWNKILSIQPLNYIAIYNRALVYTKVGKYNKALEDINIIIKNNPAFINGFEFRSQIYSMLGKKALASKDMIYAYNLRTNSSMHNKLVQKTANSHRSIKDNDINKYDKLISDNNRIEDNPYINEDNKRGRIQEKNSIIDFMPLFTLTDDVSSLKKSYYWDVLEQFNKKKIQSKLYLCNLSVSDKNEIVSTNVSRKSDNVQTDSLCEALYMLKIFDFDKSISILDSILKTDCDKETKILSLYIRSISYYYLYMLDVEQQAKKQQSKQTDRINNFNLDMAISDLSKIIEINNTNPYAYYNRSILKFYLGDRTGAMTDINKCLQLNKNIAEAYYNRAIINISLNNEDSAILDMSKAGELGIYKAYNAIKRITK